VCSRNLLPLNCPEDGSSRFFWNVSTYRSINYKYIILMRPNDGILHSVPLGFCTLYCRVKANKFSTAFLDWVFHTLTIKTRCFPVNTTLTLNHAIRVSELYTITSPEISSKTPWLL
jgi:hypothetical protein